MSRNRVKTYNRRTAVKNDNRFSWVSYLIGTTFLFAVIIGIITIIILSRDLPSLSSLEKFEPNLVTQVYSIDGKLIAEFGSEKRQLVRLDELPTNLINAVIAIEDQRFYDHWGVNIYRVPAAAFKNMLTLHWSQGFSTLTMQLARNLHLNLEKKLIRKIKEILTALQIERTYTKNEILEMYLNNTFFGHRIYGIASAAKVYLGKTVSELTLVEAATLAGIIQTPNRHSPFNNPERTKQRRNTVLRAMYDEGYIDKKQLLESIQAPVVISETQTTSRDFAPYFVEYIRIFLDENKEKLGVDYLTDGLKVFTTLDTRLQSIAENVMKQRLDEEQRRVNSMYRVRIEQKKKTGKGLDYTIQGAMISIEPSTGYIKAMIGGKNFEQSQFNRAVQALRQPGSTFKAFVYATAIDNGYKVTDKQLNQDVALFNPDGTRWTPGNFDGSRGGPTSLREALRRSLNLVSVRIVLDDWAPPKRIAYLAQKMGITSEIQPYDAIALGASDVYLIDLVSAYCVFPNLGIRVEPESILKIEDRVGRTIWRTSPRKREVLSKETTYIMTSMLQTVANSGTGAGRFGYGFDRPAGGKTGTTNDFTDAWFVGFSPQLVAGVWVGFDDPQISLGKNQTGARVALPAWAKYMKAAHDTLGLPVKNFTRPEGIVDLEVCEESGELASQYCPSVIKEIFNQRYKPEKQCSIHTGHVSRTNR